MAKIFFTSDFHFGHYNIIKYENRPFQTLDEMNNTLIFNHNNMVKKDDICYNLGDFYFRSGREADKKHYEYYLNQLKGRHVIICGNHERRNKLIDKIQTATMYISGLKIFCCHDPIKANVDFDLNICGHVHSWFKEIELKENGKKTLIVNVGTDVWDFKPVEWRDIYALYCRWKKGIIKPDLFDKKELERIRTERKR